LAIVQTVQKAATVGGVRQEMTVVDIAATATGDKSATIVHGLGPGRTPLEIQITPLLNHTAQKSEWAATTINSTNLVLTKTSATGTNANGSQIRVLIRIPHSLGQ
jgi:hypothetical protein